MKIHKKIYKALPKCISNPVRYIVELFLWITWIHKNPWHSIKQRIIKNLQKKYKISTFIETWTYEWDMIEMQKNNFKEIYSIDLSDYYYKKAKERFAWQNNIHLILWDSTIELWKLLKRIHERAIIFLDWHFSWWLTAKWNLECPLIDELKSFENMDIKNHILVIDDMRLCWKNKDYPTIEELKKSIKNINNNYKISIKNDQMISIL